MIDEFISYIEKNENYLLYKDVLYIGNPSIDFSLLYILNNFFISELELDGTFRCSIENYLLCISYGKVVALEYEALEILSYRYDLDYIYSEYKKWNITS